MEQPQCHPQLSKAANETDLQAEQDEFFLSGAVNSVKMISTASSKVGSSYTPSVSVLQEVIERDTSAAGIKPPSIKAPLKPSKIVFKKPTTKAEDNLSLEALKSQVSRENEERLSKMSAEEIEELKRELFESVPESFINKMRNK